MNATRSSAAYVDGFALHHGAVSLSFIGTVGYRTSTSVERLPDAAALVRWLRLVDMLEARLNVAATDVEYREALDLRETLARIATRAVEGQRPRNADILSINEYVATHFEAPELRYRLNAGVGQLERRVPSTVRSALGAIAADAVGVFTRSRAGSLVRCRLEECGAILFTDAGRSTRKWCSTEKCANVAKVRAFRARHA